MDGIGMTMLAVGVLILTGLLADALARRIPLPRVTLLMLIGVAAGPSALRVLPGEQDTWFATSATVALAIIGFLLGGKFTRGLVRELEDTVLRVAVVQSLATATVVGAGLILLGHGVVVSLCLAGIAVATAPAATLAVIEETRSTGRFVDVLKGIVALDDVIGILLFSLLVTIAGISATGELDVRALSDASRELGGSLALGLGLGLPGALLTGRVREREMILEEALGLVLVCSGLALWMDLSPILAAIVMGATIANLARHHERPFHEIERIEWPFLVIFFVLTGAALDPAVLRGAGGVAAAYVVLRGIGKVCGPLLAGPLGVGGAHSRMKLGMALLPQAGVALGLALVARVRFPEEGAAIFNVVVVGTVVFELVGPVLTRAALSRPTRG